MPLGGGTRCRSGSAGVHPGRDARPLGRGVGRLAAARVAWPRRGATCGKRSPAGRRGRGSAGRRVGGQRCFVDGMLADVRLVSQVETVLKGRLAARPDRSQLGSRLSVSSVDAQHHAQIGPICRLLARRVPGTRSRPYKMGPFARAAYQPVHPRRWKPWPDPSLPARERVGSDPVPTPRDADANRRDAAGRRGTPRDAPEGGRAQTAPTRRRGRAGHGISRTTAYRAAAAARKSTLWTAARISSSDMADVRRTMTQPWATRMLSRRRS